MKESLDKAVNRRLVNWEYKNGVLILSFHDGFVLRVEAEYDVFKALPEIEVSHVQP